MFGGKNVYVCDIESDGLLESVSKIWVLGYGTLKEDGTWDVGTTTSYAAIARLFENPDNIIVGHNFWLFDVPAIEKVLGIEVKATIICTLFLAWYLEPNRMISGKMYGLGDYGEDFGIPKPVVSEDEWVGIGKDKEAILSYYKGEEVEETPNLEHFKSLGEEEKKAMVYNIEKEKKAHQKLMEHRVTEDVKINIKLWLNQLSKYEELYEGDWRLIERHINFLMSKANTYYEHTKNRMVLDQELANSEIEKLDELLEDRLKVLASVMPKTPVKVKKSRPKKPFKKDGTESATGKKWFKMLDEMGLPQDYDGEIEVITKYNDPKPNSPNQIKDWLFSLGWEPQIYKKSFSKALGDFHQVPQVKDQDGNLCQSVLKMAKDYPEILEYKNVGILQHRLGLLRGFLRNMEADGTIIADVGGLTNTMRLKHRGLVNMPRPSQLYAENIRACLRVPEGMIMIGSDLSSLESVTRNAFIKPFDPEYVREMEEDPYYDAHLDIALTANMMSKNDVAFYKYEKEKSKNPDIRLEDIQVVPEGFWEYYENIEDKDKYHHDLDATRAKAKTVNYASLYNVGAQTLANNLEVPLSEAQNMLDAYWERNSSVKEFSEECRVINFGKDMWVVNPLNNFRYSLRKKSDIFSTVNQSAGDYIFTLWCETVKRKGVKLFAGFHDELVTCCYSEDKDKVIEVLYWAINKVKSMIPIDMGLGIDHKIGLTYKEVH